MNNRFQILSDDEQNIPEANHVSSSAMIPKDQNGAPLQNQNIQPQPGEADQEEED